MVEIKLLLVVLLCSGALALEVEDTFRARFAEFEAEMAAFSEPKIAAGEDKSSLHTVNFLTMKLWLSFGKNVTSIIKKYDNADPILSVLHEKLAYGATADFLLAVHRECSQNPVEITSKNYDTITGHSAKLTDNFEQLFDLLKNYTKIPNKLNGNAGTITQQIHGVADDIVRKTEQMIYHILICVPTPKMQGTIEDFGNTLEDLNIVAISLEKLMRTQSKKKSIATALNRLLDVLLNVGERIKQLKRIGEEHKTKVDWSLITMSINDSTNFQTSAAEIIFIVSYMNELDDEEMFEMGLEMHAEIKETCDKLESTFDLLDTIIDDFEDEIKMVVRDENVPMNWWNQYHDINEIGVALEESLYMIFALLPAPQSGQTFEHYTAVSEAFKNHLPMIIEKLESGYSKGDL